MRQSDWLETHEIANKKLMKKGIIKLVFGGYVYYNFRRS